MSGQRHAARIALGLWVCFCCAVISPPAASAAPNEQALPAPEVFLDGVMLPAALNFAPDGRLFFVEVNAGRIRVARSGFLQPAPFATLTVQQEGESGLLGLALDPAFFTNGFVYAFYSEGDPVVPELGLRNRLVRFTDRDGEGVDMTVLLDDLPVGRTRDRGDAHQGGALAFGPDGKLYVSLGDTGTRALAQDLSSLAGKILRLNSDGSVPDDNPFPGSPIFALGFRNVWGLAFHPRTGALWASENGSDSYDEIDLIRPGGNYGWPVVEGRSNRSEFVSPVWDTGRGQSFGMVGLSVYSGATFPDLQDSLMFCTFRDGTLHRLTLRPPEYERAQNSAKIGSNCRLGVTVGSDGAIYYASVNQILRVGAAGAATRERPLSRGPAVPEAR